MVDFLDTYIKPKTEYIRSDICRSVEFDDLWFLFQPGAEVVDGLKRQAYRVMRVTTPRHKADIKDSIQRIQRGDEVEDPFTVHCVSIGYDGVSMGPRWSDFAIPAYVGEKRINVLPVYPLRSADDDGLRARLIERGKMFFDLCQVRSMHYTGPTLGGEEVDSQVVTDSRQAITNSPEMQEMTDKVDSIDASEHRVARSLDCNGSCCSKQSDRKSVV